MSANPAPRIQLVEPLPFPAKPLAPAAWGKQAYDFVWKRMETHEFYLDDFARAHPNMMAQGLLSGGVVSLMLGDNDGVVLVHSIKAGLSAVVEVVFWGDVRAFLKKFGDAEDVRYTVTKYLFEILKVRSLRVVVDPRNKRAINLARRSGFDVTGLLYDERVMDNAPADVLILSAKREV